MSLHSVPLKLHLQEQGNNAPLAAHPGFKTAPIPSIYTFLTFSVAYNFFLDWTLINYEYAYFT